MAIPKELQKFAANFDFVWDDDISHWTGLSDADVIISFSGTVSSAVFAQASGQPDLIVSSISAPATVSQDSTLNFSYTVGNQGSGAAPSTSWAAAYLDQQVTAFGTSWNQTNALAAGASQTLANSISTAGLSVGQHTLWIKADNFNTALLQFNTGTNDVIESNENNNWNSVAFNVAAPSNSNPAPDLVVSSIAAPASVSQGATLNFSYTVGNQGSGAASSTSWAAAYLDQQVTAFGTSWNQTNALGVGASQTLANSISTAGLSLGQHTLWIKADNFNTALLQFNTGTNDVVESNENNNWNSVTFNVTGQPDLVVSSISAPVSVSQGANFNFSYVVANQGTGAASSTSWAAAYLDQQVTAFGTSWNQTDALAAGASESLTNSISTTGLSLGQHTLWIKADNFNTALLQFNTGTNDVVESNENNNWRSVTFNVTAQPDLVVSAINAPASVSQGSNFDFSYVVANQGAGAAPSTSWAAAYLDQQVTAFGTSWNQTDALAAGASETLTNSISTAGLSVGQHTLWIKADNFNTALLQFNTGTNDVVESNENNNWKSVTFNVAAPANPYNISVSFSGDTTYLPYFSAAAARWQQIITTDIPNVNDRTYGLIDDLLISASVVSIDGVGGILGQAGPDLLRNGSFLPYHGVMQFDSADLASMAANGTLLAVIMHEMGHTLGIGTIWSLLGLKSGFNYTGANALAEYKIVSGNPFATSVPLETGGGTGTAGSHWSESVFGNELMTGYIASATNPLSIVSVGTLKDMGYSVNYTAADAYTLPGHLTADLPTGSASGNSSVVSSLDNADSFDFVDAHALVETLLVSDFTEPTQAAPTGVAVAAAIADQSGAVQLPSSPDSFTFLNLATQSSNTISDATPATVSYHSEVPLSAAHDALASIDTVPDNGSADIAFENAAGLAALLAIHHTDFVAA